MPLICGCEGSEITLGLKAYDYTAPFKEDKKILKLSETEIEEQRAIYNARKVEIRRRKTKRKKELRQKHAQKKKTIGTSIIKLNF